MSHFSRLAELPPGGQPGGGDVLRRMAREADVATCPEADILDWEYEGHRQRVEEEDRLLAQREAEDGLTREPDDEPPSKRVNGVVKAGVPVVDGHTETSLVTSEVRVRIGAVKACYERALKRNSKLYGEIRLRWTISTAGRVSAVEIEEDTVGDSEICSCVKSLVGRWRFVPPSGGPADVSIPFIFEAKEASR